MKREIDIKANLQALDGMIDDLIKRSVDMYVKNFDYELEQILRTYAVPPIKGKITKGKIAWRGIHLCEKHQGWDYIAWVEQKGKQIGPTFVLKGSIDINQ